MKKLIALFSVLLTTQSTLALNCFGTEPFWTAHISEKQIELDMFVGDKLSLPIDQVSTAMGMPNSEDSFLRSFSYQNKPVATLVSQQCSDGMSEYTFPKEVILYTKDFILYGCCGEPISQK